MSPATKAKIAAAKKGKHHTLAARAKMFAAHKGRPVSDATRAKLSAMMTGRRVGPNHPLWLGGISQQPYPWDFNAELKGKVLQRDGYRCRVCKMPQAKCKHPLNVHHGDYDKMNSNLKNLVALCRSCHSATNTNRPYWTAAFQEQALVA